MRALALGVILTVATVAPGWSAECWKGSDKGLQLVNWQPFKDAGNAPGIRYEMANPLVKGVRMIDAVIVVSDVLGRSVAKYIGVKPDTVIPPGASIDAESITLESGADRLVTANRDDLVVILCTAAVVYDDGTKEEF